MPRAATNPDSRDTRLRLRRVAAQLSQDQLAEAAGITRQAVAGIEAGRFDPSLPVALRLARALATSVEELFGDPVRSPLRPARWAGGVVGAGPPAQGAGPGSPGSRVAMAVVGEQRWAFALQGPTASFAGFAPAGGVVAAPAGPTGVGGAPAPAPTPAPVGTRARHEAPLSAVPRAPAVPEVVVAAIRAQGPVVVVAGCDPALPLLGASLAQLSPPIGLLWWPCSSSQALALAAAGAVHAAGVHYPAHASPPPGMRRMLGPGGAVVVAFSAWEEGLAVADEVADQVADVGDLARLGLAVANREPGAEARALLQRECRRHGIRPTSLAGWHTSVPGHLPVAGAVAAGLAAAGITSRPAAAAYGLAFRPLAAERFDLVVPRHHLASPEVRGLFAALGGPDVRQQLGAIPGYDASACGSVVDALPRQQA